MPPHHVSQNEKIIASATENQQQPSTPEDVILGNGARRRELEELLLKLDLMEKECVQEKLIEEKEALKDDFIALKRIIYKSLMETRELIRSRYQIQLRKGQTIEVIQKGALIGSKLESLDTDFAKMMDILKKQIKQKAKKYSEEQLDQRFQDMQLIKQQIEESKSLFRNASAYSDTEVKTLNDFRYQINEENGTPQEWRDLTQDEQSVIDRWRARDQEIDIQVGEIGDAIDRLGELALQIGEKADKQSQLVKGLHMQADEANEELLTINTKLKELIVKQGGMNFFCKLILALILIGLIGYIISIINRRIVR